MEDYYVREKDYESRLVYSNNNLVPRLLSREEDREDPGSEVVPATAKHL